MPVDFEQWLRSEIEYAKTLTGHRPVNPIGSQANAAAHARLGALQEVAAAYRNSSAGVRL